jgi:hypothetical protein
MTGQEQAKSEMAGESGERRVWVPERADESRANVRVLASTPDAATAALSADLLEIAERGFGERPAAERIVGAILHNESQLVAAATRTASAAQREAAQATLASMVRRAVLDALPPVVPGSPTPAVAGAAATGGAEARKVRAVPPSEAPKPVPARARDRSKLIAAAAVGLLLLGGLAAWHFLLRPAPGVEAPAGAGDAERPAPAAAAADVLQLEAPEPAAGPLRRARPGEPAPPLPPGEAMAAAPAEAPATRRIGMAPTAREAAAVQPGAGTPDAALELPAGAADLRVFILYPEGEAAAAEASDLYTALSDSGSLPLVVLRDVTFTIASPRIRYFHDEDAAAARALAGFLDVPADGSGTWDVQNFTHISPLPAPGTLEIYVQSP